MPLKKSQQRKKKERRERYERNKELQVRKICNSLILYSDTPKKSSLVVIEIRKCYL